MNVPRPLAAWCGMLLLAGMVGFAHWKAHGERRRPPEVVRKPDGTCVTNPPPRMWTIIAETTEILVEGLAECLADADWSDD